jgi:hypothetical protein
MTEFLEDPDSHLSHCLGKDNVPFPCVCCSVITLPLEGNDPRNGCTSVKAEMAVHAPHAFPACTANNAALAKLLKEIVAKFKDAITWARDWFCDYDGCSIVSDWMPHFCSAARQEETVEITR